MAVSSLGFNSGINFDSIISQLIVAQGKPLVKLQNDQVQQELKSATVLNLKTKLSPFESSVNTLNSLSQFNTKKVSITKTSTGDELASVSTDETAIAGATSIKVKQLAKAGKKASQGIADQDATAISSVAGSIRFKIGTAGAETTVTVSTTTTLQQLRDAINAKNAGVTASIINDGTGSNPFRLILTANSSGSANNIVITNNDTTLDFANKKIEDVFKFTTNSFSGSAVTNNGNFYTGTENKSYLAKITTAGATGTAKYKLSTDGGVTFGSEITTSTLSNTASQFVIDSTNNTLIFNDGATRTATLTSGTVTADALAADIKTQLEVANGSTDTYTVAYSATTGKFTITNNAGNTNAITLNFSNASSTASGILGFKTSSDSSSIAVGSSVTSDFVGGKFIDGAGIANSTNGGVKLIFGTTGTLAIDDKFSVDGFNPAMETAQDAVVEVGNSTIAKSSNTITDVIQGVTLNLLKADSSSTLTLTVSTDTATAKKNITAFVDAYNVVAEFLNKQLSFDPKVKVANPLLGDFTLQTIRRKLGDIMTGTIPGIPDTSFNSLSSIGIKSDSKTGKMSIDDSKLTNAINKDPNTVAKLFVGLATATDSTVKFESKTAKTQPGVYSVSVQAAPEQAAFSQVAKLSGGGDARNDLSSTGLTAAETLVFLFSKNNTASSPDLTTATVTLAAGSTINTIVNDLNSAFATNKIALSASNDSGKLEIKSTDFGKDMFFQVSTNIDAASGQILKDINGSAGETLKDSGVNISGFINNHTATGLGNKLTGAPGFAEEGLVISTKSSATGGKGTVTVSSGIADQLSTVLASFTNDTTGILKTKTDAIQKTIDGIKAEQKKIEKKLAAKEESLRAQFVRLETVLAEFKSTSNFLSGQLSNLPKLGGGK